MALRFNNDLYRVIEHNLEWNIIRCRKLIDDLILSTVQYHGVYSRAHSHEFTHASNYTGRYTHPYGKTTWFHVWQKKITFFGEHFTCDDISHGVSHVDFHVWSHNDVHMLSWNVHIVKQKRHVRPYVHTYSIYCRVHMLTPPLYMFGEQHVFTSHMNCRFTCGICIANICKSILHFHLKNIQMLSRVVSWCHMLNFLHTHVLFIYFTSDRYHINFK